MLYVQQNYCQVQTEGITMSNDVGFFADYLGRVRFKFHRINNRSFAPTTRMSTIARLSYRTLVGMCDPGRNAQQLLLLNVVKLRHHRNLPDVVAKCGRQEEEASCTYMHVRGY